MPLLEPETWNLERLCVAALLGVYLMTVPALAEDRNAMLVPADLEAVRVLPIDGPQDNQPSGLTLIDGLLLAVSDKHDDTIFRIDVIEETAKMVPHVTFETALPEGVGRLDFEGITHDEAGNYYLISESAFRILKVPAAGGVAEWMTPSLEGVGRAIGLFAGDGGNFEGIARLSDGRFLLAAERQPRGLIEVTLDAAGPSALRAYRFNDTRLSIREGRNPDFSDLTRDGDRLYAIQRAAGAVSQIDYTSGELRESGALSYDRIVNSEEYRYSSMRFGHGEGLAMDDEHIYIVIDNNGDYRVADPDDRRPLLLILKRPAEERN